MLPYTHEENVWLSASRDHPEPLPRPLLTSEEVAAAIRRGHTLRAEALAQLPGQIGRAARSAVRRLGDFAGSGSAERRRTVPSGPESFAGR